MNTLQIRDNFHLLIDTVENDALLLGFYELLKKRTTSTEGQLWENLTEREKEELLIALGESENPDNLISFEEMKKKHEKWL